MSAEVVKTYRQSMPASRFIGKMYGRADGIAGFSAKWGEWHQNGWFGDIENAPGYRADFFEDGGAYIGLMRLKDGEPFQYWIGKFTPEGTTVPEGFQHLDFPASKLGVCWIRGTEPDIYGKDELALEAFHANGISPVSDAEGAFWFFERYACPRFTEPDENGNVILDTCYYIAD